MNRRGFFRGLLAAALAPAIKFFPAPSKPEPLPPPVTVRHNVTSRMQWERMRHLAKMRGYQDDYNFYFYGDFLVVSEEDQRRMQIEMAEAVAKLQSPQANGGAKNQSRLS